MKTFLIILICAIVLAGLVYVLISLKKRESCSGECGCCKGCEPEKNYAHQYKVLITGMSCGHCKARVEEAFNAKENCICTVDLEAKCAFVQSEVPLTEEEIKQTVDELGFVFESYTEA